MIKIYKQYSLRRHYLDFYLNHYIDLINGYVLDVGGKKDKRKGNFIPPKENVLKWQYINNNEKEKPDILGMSALLTTTMPYMKVVIDTLVSQGVRENYIILVGGAPLNEEFSKAIGADAYCRDAAVAVETASQLIKNKHNQLSH